MEDFKFWIIEYLISIRRPGENFWSFSVISIDAVDMKQRRRIFWFEVAKVMVVAKVVVDYVIFRVVIGGHSLRYIDTPIWYINTPYLIHIFNHRPCPQKVSKFRRLMNSKCASYTFKNFENRSTIAPDYISWSWRKFWCSKVWCSSGSELVETNTLN